MFRLRLITRLVSGPYNSNSRDSGREGHILVPHMPKKKKVMIILMGW